MRLLLALFVLLSPLPAEAQSLTPYAFVSASKASATQTNGGASQQLLGSNPGRKMFCVQNPAAAGESYWIDFGARTAVIGSSMEIPVGQMMCIGGVSSVWTGAVNGNATTTSHQVVVYEFN